MIFGDVTGANVVNGVAYTGNSVPQAGIRIRKGTKPLATRMRIVGLRTENVMPSFRLAQADALTAAQERAAKLDGLMVQITQKAGVDGKLFGSVTNSDISDALKAQGFDVPKAAIRMPAGPLKQIGDQQLKVVLHTDVAVTITVSVLGDAA